ncbi:MAG: HAMP domain-containing protein [Calditrichia bacterium]
MQIAAKRLSEGDLDLQISYRSKDELGQLGDSFRDCIERLGRSSARTLPDRYWTAAWNSAVPRIKLPVHQQNRPLQSKISASIERYLPNIAKCGKHEAHRNDSPTYHNTPALAVKL